MNRNQQRKDIPRTLMAYKEFKKECPNSVYYLHCSPKDVGWDLPKVVENLGLKVDEDVLFPRNFNVNTGFPVSVVNDLYNCGNVVISAACGMPRQKEGQERRTTEGQTPAPWGHRRRLREIAVPSEWSVEGHQ